MRHQRIDVLGPLAQRRDLDARDRQAEVQIGAERPLVGLGAQVAVGGGDDADVDLDVFLAAEAAERAALEHAEQGRLHRQRQLADLVQEDRAAVRQLERALLARSAPVKAPRSCPNSCDAISVAGSAPGSTTMNGRFARALNSWMARATSSLPVPVSPWISTETFDCASRSTVRPISCIVGLAATSPGTSGRRQRRLPGGAMVASSSASTVRPIRMRVPIGTTASLIAHVADEGAVAAAQILDQDAVLAAKLEVIVADGRVGQGQLVRGRRADPEPLAVVLHDAIAVGALDDAHAQPPDGRLHALEMELGRLAHARGSFLRPGG